jgi:hypothetical protein
VLGVEERVTHGFSTSAERRTRPSRVRVVVVSAGIGADRGGNRPIILTGGRVPGADVLRESV